MTHIDKLNNLASGDSEWLGEAKYRQKNAAWLRHSQKIAISVLRTMRMKGIKQKELAVMINVSPQQINKIVKGNGNLTLETISKLEHALGISLIFHHHEVQAITQKIQMQAIPDYWLDYVKQEVVANRKCDYKINDDFYHQDSVNENTVNYG